MSSGVLLDPRSGKPEARAPALTLYVPRGYEDEDPYPLRCLVCGTRYAADHLEAWQRHVGDCARKHAAELRELSPAARREGTLWDENQWDPELAEHMRRVGERMLAEGRFEVRPHERGGFS